MSFYIGCLFGFGIGVLCGMARNDLQLMRLLRDQQERGNYWFDKYQNLLRGGDWEPLSNSFKDEDE